MNTIKCCFAAFLALCFFFPPTWAEVIQGTVVDDQGQPVSGAVIYALDSQSRLMIDNNEIDLPEKFPRVLSSDQGTFSFPELKRPVKTLLARDLEDRYAWTTDPFPGKQPRIVIHPPASITGRLLRGKSPLPQKEITASLITDNNCGLYYRATAKTDSDGKFVFNSLLPGKYLLQIINSVPQVGCCFRNVPTQQLKVTLNPAESKTIQIGGSDLPFLHGKITDTQTNPLHGVWVYLTSDNAKSNQIGTWSDITTRDGDFKIYDIPPGQYTLHCFRRLALNNSSRTLQATRLITIKDRLKPKTPAIPLAENVSNIAIDLTPFMPLEIGQPIPLFKKPTFRGDELDLAKQRGKIIVLHFYASWCVPCIKDFPTYDKLISRFGPDKLTIVGINLDNIQEDYQAFVKKQTPRHPQIYAGPWTDSWAVKDFHIADVPTTLIVDSKGKIVQTNLFGDVLEAFIKKNLTPGTP